MELRKYIHKAVSRNLSLTSQQGLCIDTVYQMIAEREQDQPGFQERVSQLLSKHEFTGTPDWRVVQDILSSSIRKHRG